ncbi:Pyrazinamidase/nicotinamidase [Giardia muris]|uniref:nicotinamidase n=1 Tax=Giardia muris TaxID=5742 RepID=A0A4Z1SMK6_GIAMU|nr:Pyrazinamidase/nicotinamidase [Giardia muris]|eukprot:TNJ26922.1 Pyrazinamidase/nicotinamidase [Giardia muris]
MMSCLVIVDVQMDFCMEGVLAVPHADEIVEPINALRREGNYTLIVLSRDWHPPRHCSFASTHGVPPFTTYIGEAGPDVYWPDHCVADTPGAEFHPLLYRENDDIVISKGTNPAQDAYSCFCGTDLDKLLRGRGILECDFVGLALDYCVKQSALDAQKLGYRARVLVPYTRAVDSAIEEDVLNELAATGVSVVRSN